MSTPAADGGPIQNFIRSLYSSHFYSLAPGFELRVGVRNLLLLGAILGLVTATQWSSATGSAITEWAARVESGEMPALKLENGRVEARGGHQPYLRHEANGTLLIIDVTGEYDGVPDSVAPALFIGRDRAVFQTAPNVSRTYEFAGHSLGGWLDAPGLAGLRRFLVPVVLLAGTPVAFLYYVTVNAFLAVLIAAFARLLMRTFAPGQAFSYRQILTVAFFALTPVSILFRFLGLVAPEISVRLLPFYPALAVSLLLAALRASMTSPPESRSGSADS